MTGRVAGRAAAPGPAGIAGTAGENLFEDA